MSIARYANYAQPEEMFIQTYCQEIEEFYKRGTPLHLPESGSVETLTKKICQLARDNNIEGLQQLMRTCDERLLQYWVVSLVARTGDEKAVTLLINQFDADEKNAVLGYAWGGQLSILACMDNTDVPLHYKLEGFALGRHIKEVNRILKRKEENNDFDSIEHVQYNYVKGKHVEILSDTLELITLTTSKKLKKSLAHALKEKIKTIDTDLLLAKASKLAALMEEHKIDYPESLKILGDVENAELLVIDTDCKANIDSQKKSLTLFKQAVDKKLSYYQTKAIEQCQQFGLTGNIMLNWKSFSKEPFSLGHLQALKYLLKQMSPNMAIKEINRLNEHQSNALVELYPKGLRGDHLREWQKKGKIFTHSTFESLLFMCHEEADPIVALNKIGSAKPMAIPVHKKY